MSVEPDDWSVRLPWTMDPATKSELLVKHEWLVTNGLGGYASGTLAGVASRRYHGLLVAALPVPFGRQVMLNHLSELVRLQSGRTFLLGGDERPGKLNLHGIEYFQEFRLERGLPVWRYELDGVTFEKRILLPHRQNTVHVSYRLIDGPEPLRLKLRPSVHFRHYEAPVSSPQPAPYVLTSVDGRYELSSKSALPPLRMHMQGERHAFTNDGATAPDIVYRVEESRGYEAEGTLWSPGYFRVDLSRDHAATLVASTEAWDMVLALEPTEALAAEIERRAHLLSIAHPAARQGFGRDLVLAADQFLITPAGRLEDAARARAAGEEARTVIAGYHWFTDWGRDTMISLEGLTLATGRHLEAGYILRTFAFHIRDGLIPNLFPDGEKEGLFHTADATLWYFHAIDRYLAATDDPVMLETLLPKLIDIAETHLRGTRYGIGVDPDDGLLRQGEQGYQLTWMDAKVGDWVVTPRRGKAVEINALWYNALRLLEDWVRASEGDKAAAPWAAHAERARAAFNRRFWCEKRGYLYDVVDGEQGDDDACRPNQLFAISLPHAVLEQRRWQPVLEVAQRQLLTPLGLRSLSPNHPDYKSKYFGDLRARDAAYHQGTVWAWLTGPFVDAWLKVYPDRPAEARQFLRGFENHLSQTCIGSINEVFDAEAPYAARGCVAQAWSVAEVLRCWAKTAS